MRPQVRFINKNKSDFFKVLRQRVNGHFKDNGVLRQGNWRMVSKTTIMLLMYFVPYVLILTGWIPVWGMWGLCIIMGLGAAGVGMSVMHDANHGAWSTNGKLNRVLGYTLNVLGANSFTWRVQHNQMHHTFTNIHGMDEDISKSGALRLHPETKWRPHHRYQHIYAGFLYSLLTLVWIFVGDFSRLVRYSKWGETKKNATTPLRETWILILTKLIFVGYMFVIPMVFTSLAWWQVLIGFLTLHLFAGAILSLIFQLAHVNEGVEHPVPNQAGLIENDWAIHQLQTTANFAPKNRLLSWYVGGLNFQIEHHLFPNICHIHYPKIAKIVRKTAEEYGVTYTDYPTFFGAIGAHFKHLKRLGSADFPMA